MNDLAQLLLRFGAEIALPRTHGELAAVDALHEDEIVEWEASWQRVAEAFAEETSDRNDPEVARSLGGYPAGREFMREQTAKWKKDLVQFLFRLSGEQLDQVGALLGVERGNRRSTSYAFALADEILRVRKEAPND